MGFFIWYGYKYGTRTIQNVARMSATGEGLTEPLPA